MSEFIFEILSEEIPARMQEKAKNDLQKMIEEKLIHAGLNFDSLISFVTPRRLVVCAQGLPSETSSQTLEKKGPKIDAPEAAQKGFFESIGIPSDQCKRIDTGKGIYWIAHITQEGRKTIDILKEIIVQTLNEISFPKSMRWGDKKMTFVRPINQILCLFDGKKIAIDNLEIPIVNTTRGHRFMGSPDIQISSWKQYKAEIVKNHVIIDSAQRRSIILTQIEEHLKGSSYTLIDDDGLLQEVSGLVEWPHVLKGMIDPKFSTLPKELMIAVCRKHQRYFLAQDKDGNLAPFFLFAANITPKDGGATIVAGNERVLRARLADGLFFFETDQKKTLLKHLEGLKTRVFHQKLGSVYEKVNRIETLALKINEVSYNLDTSDVKTASRLCKADLTTGLVNEFPELQGIAGKYYTQDKQVGIAIEEHYKPQGPGDSCPHNPLSVIIALADKIDTLSGFFSIGEKPTGSKDPYALRRTGLGIIRLILENNLKLNLKSLLGDQNETYEFILDRLKVMLKDQNLPHDIISAILTHKTIETGDLCDVISRIKALHHLFISTQGETLRMVFSRTANILKDIDIKGEPSESIFEKQEEKDLFKAFSKINHLQDYTQAFQGILTLGEPLNTFFDHVTVNHTNIKVRENRFKLLSQIRDFSLEFANFYTIEG